MSGNVHASFVLPLRAHFEDPKVADLRAFYLDLANHLGRYSDDTLARAAGSLKLSWLRKERFPTLAACIAACDRAQQFPMDEDRKQRLAEAREKRRKEEEAELPQVKEWATKKLRAHPIGKLAAQEGWIKPLWDFVRTEARFPDKHEQEELKKQDKYTRLRFDEMCKTQGIFKRFAENIRQSYLDKSKTLSETIFTKENA